MCFSACKIIHNLNIALYTYPFSHYWFTFFDIFSWLKWGCKFLAKTPQKRCSVLLKWKGSAVNVLLLVIVTLITWLRWCLQGVSSLELLTFPFVVNKYLEGETLQILALLSTDFFSIHLWILSAISIYCDICLRVIVYLLLSFYIYSLKSTVRTLLAMN